MLPGVLGEPIIPSRRLPEEMRSDCGGKTPQGLAVLTGKPISLWTDTLKSRYAAR